MDFGVFLATSTDSWKAIKRAEELGFSHAWVFDTPLLNADPFVALAAAAIKTSRIRLGIGVLIPSGRAAPNTACALASLNALAPGRIDFGVGTGNTARRTMGLPAVTLARLEEYVHVVQALLHGETVDWMEEGEPHKIRFFHPERELGILNLEDLIPLHYAAHGPRGRRLAAKLGANWINGVAGPAMKTGLDEMRKLWQEAGRQVKSLYTTITTGGCILAGGESADSPRAKAQAGPTASMLFHIYAEDKELGKGEIAVPLHLRAQFDAYYEIYRQYEPAGERYLSNHRGHLMFLRSEEQPNITGDAIRTFTITGTRAEVVERLQEIEAMGYDQFGLLVSNGQEIAMLEEWAEVFAQV